MYEKGSRSDLILNERDRQILAGLYLSKFDSDGLLALGFDTFAQAFNVIGFALQARPSSIKNYRDEFDPIFPNSRMGWRNRETREYCMKLLRRFDGLSLSEFALLIKSFFPAEVPEETYSTDEVNNEAVSSFAQRLITGEAAERYFEAKHNTVDSFRGCELENTTKLGCGYDFRLRPLLNPAEFLAVEVKGMNGKNGAVTLTSKEHEVADRMRERFYLFVVQGFIDIPFHSVYADPLYSNLNFRRNEKLVVQVSWSTSL